MNLTRLESRALEAIDRLHSSKSGEDDLVEFKRQLPEPQRAARRIAAMANAARGVEFLWIVGVDESGSFHPISTDLAPWWDGVKAWFDGEPPVLQSTHAESALVLAFLPVRPPYVVRTNQATSMKGVPTHEVPWREGTATRTARHADLVGILVPILKTPELEVLSGEIQVDASRVTPNWNTSGALKIYIVPRSPERVTLPAHLATISVLANDDASIVQAGPSQPSFGHIDGSLANASNPWQVYCDGPGPAQLQFSALVDAQQVRDLYEIHIRAELHPVPDGPPAVLRAILPRVEGASYPTIIWRVP